MIQELSTAVLHVAKEFMPDEEHDMEDILKMFHSIDLDTLLESVDSEDFESKVDEWNAEVDDKYFDCLLFVLFLTNKAIQEVE